MFLTDKAQEELGVLTISEGLLPLGWERKYFDGSGYEACPNYNALPSSLVQHEKTIGNANEHWLLSDVVV